MQPRLPSSKKWTPLPEDFTLKIREVFSGNFTKEAAEGEFIAEGRIYPEEVLVRIGYLESGRLKQVNFEASVDYDKEKKDATKKIYAGIDAIASFMEQYFETPEAVEEFPINWHGYEFEEQMVYMQLSTINSKLEEEADRLLGLDEKALVKEHQEEEDALANAVVDTDLAMDIQQDIRKGFDVN